MAVQLPREGRYKARISRHDWPQARKRLEAEPGEWVLPLDGTISLGSVSWLKREGPIVLHDILDQIEWKVRGTVNGHLGTSAEGTLYGRYTPGEKAPAYVPGIMTDEEVVQAREAYAAGEASQMDLAKKYGLSLSGMNLILRGKTRAAAGGPLHPTRKKKERSA